MTNSGGSMIKSHPSHVSPALTDPQTRGMLS